MTHTSIAYKLRSHVEERSGPVLENGAWQLMLDAADKIEKLEAKIESLEKELLEAWEQDE